MGALAHPSSEFSQRQQNKRQRQGGLNKPYQLVLQSNTNLAKMYCLSGITQTIPFPRELGFAKFPERKARPPPCDLPEIAMTYVG